MKTLFKIFTNFILYKTLSALTLILFISISCNNSVNTNSNQKNWVAGDTIRILTLNTSTSYFIYRDQEMGYHYDMIKSFADEKGLELEVVVAKNNASLYQMLSNNEMKDSVLYCGLSEISHQVLVQRSERGDTIIKDVTELIDKDVYVLHDSKYETRVQNLNNELGGGIIIKHMDQDSLVVEDLIRMVSRGEIKYTVAENNVARVNHTYFRNLDIDLPISFDQLNAWFERADKEQFHLRFSKRYFEESKGFHNQNQSSYITLLGPGQISHWDKYFKQYASQFNLDWRLLASISYYESTFDPEVKSWAGAGGLMGIMPATARSMGVDAVELYTPEVNIYLGARYLRGLIDIFSNIKFALASYNGGIGHITDARALADKYDADKNLWEGNVERYLQLKRLEQYYKDPVCNSGYFRADETVNYVHNVIGRWNEYKKRMHQ